jgi:hypothetical protein
MWTKKHDEFCLAHNIRPAAAYLWRYLMRQTEANAEQELDFNRFSHWVKKHRRDGFDRSTLLEVITQLVEVGVVKELKVYSWHTRRVVCFDLKTVLAEKSRSRGFGKPTPSRNPRRFKEIPERKVRQQQLNKTIEEIRRLSNEAGLKFDEAALTELAMHGTEAVEASIALYRVRSITSEIGNPEGWVRQCVRKGWHLSEATDRSSLSILKRMEEVYCQAKEWLISTVGSLPTAYDGLEFA